MLILKARQFDLSKITNGLSYLVLADGSQVNLSGISDLSGVAINNHILTLATNSDYYSFD